MLRQFPGPRHIKNCVRPPVMKKRGSQGFGSGNSTRRLRLVGSQVEGQLTPGVLDHSQPRRQNPQKPVTVENPQKPVNAISVTGLVTWPETASSAAPRVVGGNEQWRDIEAAVFCW